MTEISFLLPVYNGAAYLGDCLRSLLAQDHTDFDIVLIDDGSTDGSAEIADRFEDPRIRIYQKENGGLVDALNFGIERISAGFVARIDADDLCAPHRLSAQREFMEFTMADAVSCAAVDIDANGVARGTARHTRALLGADPRFVPAQEPYLPHPFMMLRREVFETVGPYAHAHLAEDSDLCWRLSEQVRIALQSDVLGQYRIHGGSVSGVALNAGRVQAFYSQLAALNACRRQQGQSEIPYQGSLSEAKALAGEFSTLVAGYEAELDPAERAWLLAASAAKFLDLATWRNFEITSAALAELDRDIRAIDIGQINQAKIDEIKSRLPKS